jgi:hypothetical protein
VPAARHLLQVGPVLRPIEERLEHGEVAAGKERDVVTGERFPSDALADVCVERRGVEEHVDGRLGPPEACLTVDLELCDRLVVDPDIGRVTLSAARRCVRPGTNTLTSMSMVPRARCVHQARARAPPNACGKRAASSAWWMAMILSASEGPSSRDRSESGRGEGGAVARGEDLGELEHFEEFSSPGRRVGGDLGRARDEGDLDAEATGGEDPVESVDVRRLAVLLVRGERRMRCVRPFGQLA